MQDLIVFAALALSAGVALAQSAEPLPAPQQVARAFCPEVRSTSLLSGSYAGPAEQEVYGRDGTISLWQPNDN